MTVQEVNLKRRSIQNFDPNREVSMELVKRIIGEAVYAPSGYNLQPWRVIIVKDSEHKKKLYEASYNQQKLLDAPMTLIIVADKEGYKRHNKVFDQLEEEFGKEKVDEFIERLNKGYGKDDVAKTKFAHLNTALFAMNIMMLVEAYGMHSHAIGGTKEAVVKELFGMKDHEEINMLLPIGYRNQDTHLITRKYRKSFEDIVTIY